jgi:hypothetical protein
MSCTTQPGAPAFHKPVWRRSQEILLQRPAAATIVTGLPDRIHRHPGDVPIGRPPDFPGRAPGIHTSANSRFEN